MEEEIGVLRAPEALAAERESFIDQDSVRREGPSDRRQQRPVQIVGHDDPIIPFTERLAGAGLQIDLVHLAACSGERQKSRNVVVDGAHRETGVAQKARMPSAAGRNRAPGHPA